MSEPFPMDLEDIQKIIDEAEVIVIGFVLFPQRLLVDARYDGEEGPLIRVVAPVGSWEERLRQLRRWRPRFSVPETHAFFVWPKSVATFEAVGLWGRLEERCRSSGHPEVEQRCREVVEELQQLEKEGVMEAIRGETYHTIWRRSG